MGKTTITKQELLCRLDKLPEDYLEEVLDFINYLISKKKWQKEMVAQEDLDPEKDPLLKFIGNIEHGTLTKDLDAELYGE